MITNGQYIRQRLIDAGREGIVVADIHRERKTDTNVKYKTGTYMSFYRLFRWFIDLKWVVPTGKKETATAKGGTQILAHERTYYRITQEGKKHDEEDWKDPIAFVHPEWAGGNRAKKYRKPTGKPRGRPRAKPRVEKPPKEKVEKPPKEKVVKKPKVTVALTQEERDGLLKYFRETFGREPTRMEIYELFSEELKLKKKRVESGEE